jgi:protein tyrosine/serine phosphatase
MARHGRLLTRIEKPEMYEGEGRNRKRAVLLLPLWLSLCGWLPNAAGSEFCTYDFPLDANPTPITGDDICNFHQVDASVYRGGRPRTTAFPKLAGLGIRTIINLEEKEFAEDERARLDEINRTLPSERQIQFVSFPISPAEMDETGISHGRLRELFEIIRKARRPLFIHCYHGKDRTGAIVALYRQLMGQKSATEAYEEAYHYRFSRSDHGLSRTLDRYNSAKRLRTLPRPEPVQ